MSVPGELPAALPVPRHWDPLRTDSHASTSSLWTKAFHDDFHPNSAPETLATFMGRELTPEFRAQAEVHLATVVMFVKGYTRGNGWNANDFPHPDIVSVILTATARLITNAAQVESETTESYSVKGSFQGFTLLEQITLNRFRPMAG